MSGPRHPRFLYTHNSVQLVELSDVSVGCIIRLLIGQFVQLIGPWSLFECNLSVPYLLLVMAYLFFQFSPQLFSQFHLILISLIPACLYQDGSSYRGNISVTISGIPCQSWTEQCPHRHTMNKTYPELKTAENHCRNPQGSGQRPWCFTTDRNKRWEYCEIPKCIPGT